MTYETYDTSKINNIKFTQGFRGYDTAEVDEFLDDIVREIEKLNSNVKNLKEDLAREKRKNAINEQEIKRLEKVNVDMAAAPVQEAEKEPEAEKVPEPEPVVVKEAPKPVAEDNFDEMKNLIAETLLGAKKSAEKVVKEAENKAEEIIEDAERRARERVVSLKAEIVESEQKLGAIYDTVNKAKEKYIKAFQSQIAEISNISVGNDDADKIPTTFYQTREDEATLEELQEAEKAKEKVLAKEEPKAKEEIIAKEEPVEKSAPVENKAPAPEKKYDGSSIFNKLPKPPSADNNDESYRANTAVPPSRHGKDEGKEAPAPKAEFNVETIKRVAVNPYDDDVIEQQTKNQTGTQHPNSVYTDEEEVADDNQQYIELALSKYNDNKYHNRKYPDKSANDIMINKDDDDQGIFQPEDRSILSSVIEDILNNKKDSDD